MLERLVVGFFYLFHFAANAPVSLAATLGTKSNERNFLVELKKILDEHQEDANTDVEGPDLELGTEMDMRASKCGYLAEKVVDSISYHLAHRQKNSFMSTDEAKAYMDLKEGENGVDILTEVMRVLGNYTLAEGIMSGTIWTIDNHNRLVSCMQNLNNRLEENTITEKKGDALMQGDMAVTNSLCKYSEQSSKVSEEEFAVGTLGCMGVTGCQFAHPDEAVHFCNSQPECTLIMGKEDETGCEGGLGCYKPRKGEPAEDASWNAGGGRTYIKICPGALLEMENHIQEGLRQSGNRWKDGEIDYCFSAELGGYAREAVGIAIKRIHEQVPCVNFNFVERGNDKHCVTQPSIIFTAEPTGCWSYVGQVSGTDEVDWKYRSQPLNLDRGCELVGVVMHQLGHAMGMVHENSRADRDKVMKLNDGNVTAGNSIKFAMSSDVIKYAWAGHDACAARAGRTKITMNKTNCLAIKGYYNPAGLADDADVECELDICEAGTMFPAPRNQCKRKVAEFHIKMERKDCRHAQGSPPGAEDADPYEWISCLFDVCTDMGLHLAKPFSCDNKIAYGYIQTEQSDCTNMEGSVSVQHAASAWVNCYMDFCSGEFDAPFDFLSLMMYSPYAWTKGKTLLTLEPLGEHADKLTLLMGQRMGFSALDIYHLGHMYGCYDKIKPDFDSKNVSRRIITGDFFNYEGLCRDKEAEDTGFDIHGEEGFMKHAKCDNLMQDCESATIGAAIQKVCPVSCFICMPEHGLMFGERPMGACFDAVNTGIRFRDGPKATCKDLVNYCNHTTIGAEVMEACKLTCGQCDPHVYMPFIDPDGKCEDAPMEEEPQFTIAGIKAPCHRMAGYCQDHPDSYLVRRKCPHTCGMCGEEGPTLAPPKKPNDVFFPGDPGGECNRRRRFGFCGTRRRRNV